MRQRSTVYRARIATLNLTVNRIGPAMPTAVRDEVEAMDSKYLDRLARSARFDSWQTMELTEALAMLDDAAADRPQVGSRPQVVSIRLQIYRQRLLRELDERATHHGS